LGNAGELAFYTAQGDSVGEGSDPIERLRIDREGNVGIGTTSPGAKLDVVVAGTPDAVTDANMRLVDSGNNFLSIQSGTTSRAGVTFGDSGDGDIASVKFLNTGTSATGSDIQTKSGRLDLTAAESARIKGIRGATTDSQLELYSKVSIGDPGGWGSFVQAPANGLSTWGGAYIGNDEDSDYLSIDSDGTISDAGGNVIINDGLDINNHGITNIDWSNSDDGSGSGLDADLWDGNQFASYLNQAVLTTSAPTFATVNTGQGANELYDMNQNVLTSSGVTFGSVNTGDYYTDTTSDYNKYRVYGSGNTYSIGMASAQSYGGLNDWAMTFTMNNEADRGFLWRDDADAASDGAMSLTTGGILTVKSTGTFGGALSAPTLNTGQGANELYDMNQNVLTTSGVTFATLNTGQGANELYDMNQNVLTSSSPTFTDLTLSGGDLSITNNNGGINFNDASAYWLKTATNWGIYWDTSANTIGFRGSGIERGYIDLDNGNLQMDGTITAPTFSGALAGNATTATWADTVDVNASDTGANEYKIVWNSGDTLYSTTGITINRDAKRITATTFSGALSGNATTATTLQTARTINGVSFNGSANITVEPYIENDDSTNATRYLTFSDTTTAGYKRLNEDSSLTYNPSTNVLTAGTFVGTWSGTTIAVNKGGTGASSLTGVLKGNGTSAFTAMTGTANYVARWTDANTLGTGVLYDNASGIRIYNSGKTQYVAISHDGSNTAITSSTGEVQIGTAGNDVYLGSSGSAANLIFEESASILGQGSNTITLGQSGDTFDLSVTGVTYNVGTLTGSGVVIIDNNSAASSIVKVTNSGAGTANVIIEGSISTGVTSGYTYNKFGNGTPGQAAISDVSDVFIAGDLEVNGTAYLAGGTAWTQGDFAENMPVRALTADEISVWTEKFVTTLATSTASSTLDTLDNNLGDDELSQKILALPESGDVLVIDPQNEWSAVKNYKANSNQILGVVSTDPAGILRGDLERAGKEVRPVALTGTVPVKVSFI